MPPDGQISALSSALGYRFENHSLPALALTHGSYSGGKGKNNQRLEFLGDAVLDLVISERLYTDTNVDEGHLSRMRANIVCEASLAQAARHIGLGPMILLGKGEEATGGRDKPSILADVMEAILGAVYLDGGLAAVRDCVDRVFQNTVQTALDDGGGQDHKTLLQQLCAQKNMAPPAYQTLSTSGPPHAPLFTIGVFIGDGMLCSATGKSKKKAEQSAAEQAIDHIMGKAETDT